MSDMPDRLAPPARLVLWNIKSIFITDSFPNGRLNHDKTHLRAVSIRHDLTKLTYNFVLCKSRSSSAGRINYLHPIIIKDEGDSYSNDKVWARLLAADSGCSCPLSLHNH